MDNTFKSPNVLSLCTGMRGLERGIERAIGKFRTVAYVEIEAFIAWNLAKTMEQGVLGPAPIWSNLKTFPWKEFYGKVHGIIGGYPCQPFSNAGKRKGVEDPRHLWPYIKTGIRAIKPVWCFFENVPGHLSLGYREVRSDLEELGYTVKEGLYSAEEAGASHIRKRLFILAVANNYINGIGALDTETLCQAETVKGPEQRKGWKETFWERLRPQSGDSSKMGHLNSEGLSQSICGELGSVREEKEAQPWREYSGTNAKTWPSPPGFKQHEWEQPRVKSRVGFTINGYNFREDLLRMAGNGVVEQTAELAFLDLLKKTRNCLINPPPIGF